MTYHITRDGVNLAGCTRSSTSCTDTPGSGVHLYRAYAVGGAGVASPVSAALDADVPTGKAGVLL